MKYILIIFLVFVFLFSACKSTEPTQELTSIPLKSLTPELLPTTASTRIPNPLEEEIIGIWIYDNHTFQQYNEDGRYSWAWSEVGLEEGTVDRGSYTLDGNILTLTRDADSPVLDRSDCAADEPGMYEIKIGQWGEMVYGLISDPCNIAEETNAVRFAPFESAILGIYRAVNDPNYWMYLTEDGYICDGNSMEAAIARTHCNTYTLEDHVLIETCEVGPPGCARGDICRAEVLLDKYNFLSYRIDAMACGIYFHLVTDPALPEMFVHVYPRE